LGLKVRVRRGRREELEEE
jgi:hypothetical protein